MSFIRSYPITFQLSQPLRTAKAEYSKRRGIILEATLPNGARVAGEASPLPGFSHESFADVTAAIPDAVALIERELNVVLNSQWPTPFAALDVLGSRFIDLPSLRFALECFVLAAIAKSQGLPLASLLAKSPRSEVERNVALGTSSQVELLSDPALLQGNMQLWRSNRIRVFKIKLSPDSIPSTLIFAKTLRQLQPDCELRLDTNQSFTLEAWHEVAATFAPLKIDFVEEPILNPTPEMFDQLITNSPIKIALDESLLSPAIYSWLAANKPALGALILKPSLLGGITAVWKLAEMATTTGTPIVISSLLESSVATEANVEIAKAVPGKLLACGLSRRFRMLQILHQ